MALMVCQAASPSRDGIMRGKARTPACDAALGKGKRYASNSCGVSFSFYRRAQSQADERVPGLASANMGISDSA